MKPNKKTTRTIPALLACALLSVFSGCQLKEEPVAVTPPPSLAFTPADYAVTDEPLGNPYIGWFRMYGYVLSDTNELSVATVGTHIFENRDNALALLEINLREFADGDLSDNALGQLDHILTLWGGTGKQLIVRFLYDWNGKASETEPADISIIKRHMEQTAEIVNAHRDDIYMLQGIFVGDCGEMHGSVYMETSAMRELAKKLAEVTDPSIFLAVRTPAHWRAVNETFTPLAESDAFTGSIQARIGLFNDGMLGSESDLGTYGATPLAEAKAFTDSAPREEELSFQDQLCLFVPNGGEAVLDNPFNDIENAVQSLSAMHVSYLSCAHDTAVLEKWKSSTYEGQNAYTYIQSHLGYRYAVTNASMTVAKKEAEDAANQTESGEQSDGGGQTDRNAAENRNGKKEPEEPAEDAHYEGVLSLSIENSGFSGSYRAFVPTLRLVNTETQVQTLLTPDVDSRSLLSGRTTVLEIPVPIEDIPDGQYEVYFQLYDPATGKDIRFANTSHTKEKGTLVGKFTLTKAP